MWRHTCERGPDKQEARMRERSDTLIPKSQGSAHEGLSAKWKRRVFCSKSRTKGPLNALKMHIFPSVSPLDVSGFFFFYYLLSLCSIISSDFTYRTQTQDEIKNFKTWSPSIKAKCRAFCAQDPTPLVSPTALTLHANSLESAPLVGMERCRKKSKVKRDKVHTDSCTHLLRTMMAIW